MRKISCREVSNDENVLYIKKICLDRYMELKLSEQKLFELDEEPIKKYEIYKISFNIEQIMLCNTKYFSDTDEKEVYYDKNIALKIYDLIFQLENNVTNSFPELIEMYQEEIYNKEKEIKKLKNEDERKYQEAQRVYDLVNKTEILQKFRENYQRNKEELLNLKKKLCKNNEIIINLSKKLEISLYKYEELKYKTIPWWKKILKLIINIITVNKMH